MSSPGWAWARRSGGAARERRDVHGRGARLVDCSPAHRDPAGALLPPLAESRRVSRVIALAVAAAAQREGLAVHRQAEDLERILRRKDVGTAGICQ